MKPKYNTSKLRNTPLGASLVTAITICLGGSAFATNWDGDVSTDWNDNNNWSGNAGTGGSNAVINITPSNVATISANIVATPVDILIGDGGSTNGRLIHTAGTAQTGANNWMIVGRGNGTGVYDLSNPAGTGGALTGHGLGSGSMVVGNNTTNGRLYVGDGGTGTVNVNTSGTLTIRNDLNVGVGGNGNGNFKFDAGTVTTGGWNFIGNGDGSVGTFSQSGGTFTNTGRTYIGGRNAGGTNSGTGNYNISGGTNTNNDNFSVGSGNLTATNPSTLTVSGGTLNVPTASIGGAAFGGGDSNPGKGTATISGTGLFNLTSELWVGQGSNSVGVLNITGGTVTQNNWLAVGRDGGTGTVNMSGGTWNKNGGGAFIVGASGPGTVTQTGGTINVNSGDVWVGEGGTAILNINTGATFNAGYLQVARNGGSTGTMNLNGGTLNVNRIDGGGGNDTVNFDGTQINATGNQVAFLSNLNVAEIKAGGFLINSGAFTLSSNQPISGTAGGVVKTGSGKLSLLGSNSYNGPNTISGGQLVLTAGSVGGGAITLANGTSLGVTALFAGAQLPANTVTFGTGNSVNLNLGDVAGTNPGTPILDTFSGPLALAGNVTVNVAGSKFQATDLPLVAYNNATRTGPGTFTLGTLPNGVVATLVDNPNYYGAGLGLVYLNITSVALPEWDGTNVAKYVKTADVTTASFDVVVTDATNIAIGQKVFGPGIPVGALVSNIVGNTITLDQAATATTFGATLRFTTGTGTNDGVWDINLTQNWVDQVTGSLSVYKNPNPVLFSDNATGPTAVTLNATVTPSEVVFNNSNLAYSLSGTGKVSGTASLTKNGTGTLAINTTNDYTGVTNLGGGVTTVTTALTNAGVASALGASTASASNLVFSGGTLNATGPAASIDRGFTVSAPAENAVSTLNIANDLTTTGQVTNGGLYGRFVKQGAGVLTINNALTNVLGTGDGTSAPYRVDNGSVVLKGGGTFSSTGEFWVGSTSATGAALIVDGSTLTTNNWISVGRGNGSTGLVSTAEFKNGAIVNSGNFSIGFDGGVVGHLSTQTVTIAGSTVTTGTAEYATSGGATSTANLTGASTMTSGNTDVGVNGGSNGTLNIGGTSTYTSTARMFIGREASSVGLVTVLDSGTLNKTGGWFSIGGNGQGTLTVKDSGTVNSNGDFNVGDVGAAVGILNIQDNGKVISTGPAFFGKNGTTGTLNMTGSATSSMSSGNTEVGGGGGSHGTMNISGGTYTSGGRLQVGPGAGSTGLVTLSGNGHMTVNSYVSVGFNGGGNMTIKDNATFSNTDDFSVNESGDVAATVSVENSASLSTVRTIFVGRNAGRTGTLNVSGSATVNQTDAGYAFIVGPAGTGTVNISGSAAVSSVGTAGLIITNTGTGVGTVNLNGGSLTVMKVSDGGGASALYFDGGTLKAQTGANAAFLAGLDTLQIKAGGATIDTNGQNVTISQGFSNDGSSGNFTKTGAGTLFLNGTVSINGSSHITAGTISGLASFQGVLSIEGTSTLNPGTGSPGAISATTVNFASTAKMAVDLGAAGDQIIADDLNLNGATLQFNGTPTQPLYIIADYANLTGQFAGGLNPPGLPAGYTIDYAYINEGSTTIALIQTATPYTIWANANITAIDGGADASPAGDPDHDGKSNLAEFALNGNPLSGSNSGKVVSKIANVGGVPSLVLTIPVRGPSAVSPSFSGGTEQVSAVTDGIVYHAQGGINLTSWGSTVTEVTGGDKTAIETGLPVLDSGWFYRTFTTGAVSGNPKDFMRAVIEQP